MLEKGLVESDAHGHFRLAAEKAEDKKKRWLSPQLKKLLDGGGPEEVTEIEDPDEANG